MIEEIAKEGLKPVSKFIDSLLAPKMQRIKRWAEKQDLTHRAKSQLTNELVEKYLQRLLRRICGITTIVFPQQVLPITALYEPLSLSQKYQVLSLEAPEPEFNIETLKEGENLLIIDSAGMGKSTFAKHLVLEILDKTDKIPIFLELRRIGETENLLEKIAVEIDADKKDVNENLLLEILGLDNFIFIFDGYDEMADQTRDKIGDQISQLAIRFEQNSIILTSRPEVTLPEIPQSTVFKINSLTVDQATSLLLRYDSIAKIDVGRKLIEQIDYVKSEFLETPLLVVLLYRTYGFNQSIATKVSSFYDEIYNALYKGHDLTKSGFAREKASKLDSEDFRRLLRGFSFILSVQGKENLRNRSEAIGIIEDAIKLTSITPKSSSAFLEDLLLTVPLLIKDGTEMRFSHKSFREFFSAEFLSVYSKSKEFIRSLNDSLLESFADTFDFISEINPDLFKRVLLLPVVIQALSNLNDYPKTVATARLIGKFYIGLWDYDKYSVKSEDLNDFEIPTKDGTSYSYGKIQNKKYILASTYSDTKKLPSSVWESISDIEDENDIAKQYFFSDKVDSFAPLKNFPKNKWIEVEDKIVLAKLGFAPVELILKRTLNFEQSFKARKRSKIAVVNEHRCKDIVKSIDKENAAQDWLNDLISK